MAGPVVREWWRGLLPGSELLFGVAVVAAATLLILPIPAGLMDILLALNIAFAVVMLLLGLQARQALQAASFPALLLVATLFRLALNVSTTRMILLDADAGEVVRAFGSFVVQANPLVGGTVFLILTVVQFVVIAKGSERVAEVTARFALDGMPGKQMSIDADLRSGAIDQEEASRRRLTLEREAQFHGAMDGAMKFVKGDAVAGMFITAVNIVGGLAVGAWQRGLDLAQAVDTYTVLTIGDGLVSQIPALLVSIAAGLVVTGVRAAGPGEPAAGMMRQLGDRPEVSVLAAGVLVLLGVVPGLPALPFCLLGAALGGAGWCMRRKMRSEKESANRLAGAPGASITLRLGGGRGGDGELEQRLESIRRQVAGELGIPVPPIQLEDGATPGRWTLLIDESPVAAGRVHGGNDPLLDEVAGALRRSAARLLGVQETQDMLDRLERTQPALVREVVPRLIPTVLLSDILARQVEEGVPVRNLRLILATLAGWARSEADPAALSERVREAQGKLITSRIAPEGRLRSLLLDPAVEQVLTDAMHRTESGTTLALSPGHAEALLRGLERALDGCGERQAVVLTRPELRRPFWKLINVTHPGVQVVSFLELDPEVGVSPTGSIRMDAA